ncbi:sigma factor-like helix-turn-helix DNA-binding protein [Phenylobacterium sp. VNQ135]|uniref:sigma factor-like helix-turn-helix DNA-binding protein n=1 Tax=Phenylobacterium sp. VNQ135 TaxID=3400922 RepID=UPI003BFBEC4D
MRRTLPKLRGYAMGLTGSTREADALVAAALSLALHRRATGSQSLPPRALFRAVRDIYLAAAAVEGPLHEAPSNARAHDLPPVGPAGWLQTLAPLSRDVLLLWAAGWSTAEGARISGCSPRLYRRRLARARAEARAAA